MRRGMRVGGISSGSIVEQLEGRMLLSAAWTGTWKITGLDVKSGYEQPSTHLSAKWRSSSARIASTDTDGQYTITLSGLSGLNTFTATGDDSKLSAVTPVTDGSYTLSLTKMGPGAIAVTRVFQSPASGSPNSMSFFGGIGTQGSVPTVAFPWEGTFQAQVSNFEFEGAGGPVPQWQCGQQQIIGRADGRGFRFGPEEDPYPPLFMPQGKKLVNTSGFAAGPGLCEDEYQALVQGPYGHLCYAGVRFRHQIADGQLVSGSVTAAFAEPNVNISPTLTKSGMPRLNAINEDEIENPGTSVAELLGSGGDTYVHDPNAADAVGIAVVGADTKNGAWQYRLEGGNWLDLGKVNNSAAMLLPPSAAVRFVPETDFYGTIKKALSFRAWDGSSGQAGNPASVNASGKMTAFSSTIGSASLEVKPVNDAPVIAGDLAPIAYKAGARPVSIFSRLKITDIDSPLLNRVTVTFGGLSETDQITHTMPKGITITPETRDGTMKLTITPTQGVPMKISAFMAALKSIKFGTPNGGRMIGIAIEVLDEDAYGTNDLTTAGLHAITIS